MIEFVTTKILMLQQTFQSVKRSMHEICRDISKLCRDNDSRGIQGRNVATTLQGMEIMLRHFKLCRDNDSRGIQGKNVATNSQQG